MDSFNEFKSLKMTSLLQLLNGCVNNCMIDTGSRVLNDLLGGGFSRGQITELTGEAGSGKTQTVIQVAVNIAADNDRKTLAVILDTEGKICARRILQVVESNGHDPSCMNRIIIKRIRDVGELLATVQLLPAFQARNQNKMGGILIDSITQPFRFTQNNEDRRKNGGYLYRICETLNELAYENNIPVILTNQISIKVEQNKNGGTSEIIPALGESWTYAPSVRILLKHKTYQDTEESPGSRVATILKSPAQQHQKKANFCIKTSGICDS